MNIIAFMAARNEADRYLESSIKWALDVCDHVFVWDDFSEDDTFLVAREHGAYVGRRSGMIPSFMDDEGAFRQRGWKIALAMCGAGAGDWVLSIDSDEFLVGEDPHCLAERAQFNDHDSIEFPVVELFNAKPPMKRVDGYWNQITAHRMCQVVNPNLLTFKAGMGSGSVPLSYKHPWPCDTAEILHYGYAVDADRQAKYERYTQAVKNGHSSVHIGSIIKTPVLEEYTGILPAVWRGSKVKP